jgi:hypothetical protein
MLLDVPDFPSGSVYFPAQAAGRPAPSAARAVFADAGAIFTRPSLEAFIAARFAKAYGAQLTHYCRHLVGLRRADDGWRAAVGYTAAREGPLFLEHYLDVPVERAIAAVASRTIRREEVVEVGNLAATSPGAAREIIQAMAAYLPRAGFRWVTFTATRELRNTFARLRLGLASLGSADARRVPGEGTGWGDYYAHDPRVVFVGMDAVR